MHIIIYFLLEPAATWIYTLSLHDALPILLPKGVERAGRVDGHIVEPHQPVFVDGVDDPGTTAEPHRQQPLAAGNVDRKSTRLNSSHSSISYAVFCLKKKMLTALLTVFALS